MTPLSVAVDVVEATSAVDALVQLSGPAVLAFVFVLLLRGDMVTKGHTKTVEEERDRWREIAMQAIEIGQAAVTRRHGDGG